MTNSYSKSGVNLEAGYEVIERIKKHIEKTKITGMIGGIGGFGGAFDLSDLGYKQPVLISGSDGVGTKLLIAKMLDKHNTIGQDLVAMCVNDIITQGAKPLYFLDYIAIGKNNPDKIEQIIIGIADGCIQAECSLIGGETAEMPDMYSQESYDLAGFATGIVEKTKLITGYDVNVGDAIIGINSSGLHSNGFSLVRQILLKNNSFSLTEYQADLNDSLANILLTPTKIYVKPILSLLDSYKIKAISHITGGGFYENLPRILNKNQGATINKNSWKIPAIFNFLQQHSDLNLQEMFNVFNMGIGMILIVKQQDVNDIIAKLSNLNEEAYLIGEVNDNNNIKIQ